MRPCRYRLPIPCLLVTVSFSILRASIPSWYVRQNSTASRHNLRGSCPLKGPNRTKASKLGVRPSELGVDPTVPGRTIVFTATLSSYRCTAFLRSAPIRLPKDAWLRLGRVEIHPGLSDRHARCNVSLAVNRRSQSASTSRARVVTARSSRMRRARWRRIAEGSSKTRCLTAPCPSDIADGAAGNRFNRHDHMPAWSVDLRAQIAAIIGRLPIVGCENRDRQRSGKPHLR